MTPLTRDPVARALDRLGTHLVAERDQGRAPAGSSRWSIPSSVKSAVKRETPFHDQKAFDAVAETFLAQCLGGSYEPVGDDFKGSTIQVPAGADQIYGLSTALPPAKP